MWRPHVVVTSARDEGCTGPGGSFGGMHGTGGKFWRDARDRGEVLEGVGGRRCCPVGRQRAARCDRPSLQVSTSGVAAGVQRLCAARTVETDEGERDEGERDEGESDEGERDEGERDEGESDEGESDEGDRDEGERDEGESDEGDRDEGESDEGESDEGERDEGESDEGDRDEGERDEKEGDERERRRGEGRGREHRMKKGPSLLG
eukprot:354940-Chlamydomonas_euryale.AAC.1